MDLAIDLEVSETLPSRSRWIGGKVHFSRKISFQKKFLEAIFRRKIVSREQMNSLLVFKKIRADLMSDTYLSVGLTGTKSGNEITPPKSSGRWKIRIKIPNLWSFNLEFKSTLLHGVWKSQKKSHSTLRASGQKLTKMPKMVHFGGQTVLPDRSVLIGKKTW